MSLQVKEVGTVPGAEYSVNDFDEAFNKMARSAGVSDIAEAKDEPWLICRKAGSDWERRNSV